MEWSFSDIYYQKSYFLRRLGARDPKAKGSPKVEMTS